MAATLPAVHPLPAPDDFEAIEAAVMETARGRWFLAEYARRMRAAETDKLLEAVTRIERTLRAGEEDLERRYVMALSPPEMGKAVSAVQERLSEIAWSLRERGFDERACAQIEDQARALGRLAEAHCLEEGAAEAPMSAPDDVLEDAAADIFEDATMEPAMSVREPAPAMVMQSDVRITSLAAIDALDDRARARLFY